MPRREGAEKDWTKPRSIRIPDELWTAAQAEAKRRGESVTDAIVRSLKRYVRPHA